MMGLVFSRQQGAALFIALIILLLVSLAGISALKSGIFHERMAFNSQAEELTFQASETAINGIISEARSSGAFAQSIKDDSKNVPVAHCVTSANGVIAGACTASDTLDQRSAILANAESQFYGKRPIIGTDPEAFMHHQFSTIGTGEFASNLLPFVNKNYQGWSKIGPGVGGGVFQDNTGDVN